MTNTTNTITTPLALTHEDLEAIGLKWVCGDVSGHWSRCDGNAHCIVYWLADDQFFVHLGGDEQHMSYEDLAILIQ